MIIYDHNFGWAPCKWTTSTHEATNKGEECETRTQAEKYNGEVDEDHDEVDEEAAKDENLGTIM